ncbi:NmrA family transcriptional regulator [Micromonospora rosaria]|uniref:NmrA family transcriptional regulator n=1 Tax=Micromonospora rosaria TaxID=47874 RepID=A0A136PJ60_9ACTN|nr:NmrA family transcriptional regulator [Micromonospora rosaria]
MIVTGASGALGSLVVDELLRRVPAERVVAVTRVPARLTALTGRGVTVRHGDYDDPASLRSAFRGASRLLLVSSPELDPARRSAQHRAAVDAARHVAVGAVAYTSFLGADTDATGLTEAHHATERAIEASGLPYTLLRHPFYSDAFLDAGLRAAVAAGEVTSSTGGQGLNTALRRDLAEAAAVVLTGAGHLGRGYDLTGPLWTYPELAAVLTALTGTPVRHREVPAQPGAMGWLHGLARSGALRRQTGDLAGLLGRAPVPLRQAVAEALAHPAP